MLLTCEAGAISAPPSPPDDGKVGVSTDQWTHAGREHRIVDAPSPYGTYTVRSFGHILA